MFGWQEKSIQFPSTSTESVIFDALLVGLHGLLPFTLAALLAGFLGGFRRDPTACRLSLKSEASISTHVRTGRETRPAF